MPEKDIDQIKVHLPKDLKAKFAAKVKKAGQTQTSVLKSYIHKFINE
jgi:predicted DNA-binding protein